MAKSLNKVLVNIIVIGMEVSDIANITDIQKKTGIHIPLFLYAFLVFINLKNNPLIYIILLSITLILVTLNTFVYDEFKALISKSKGNEISKNLAKKYSLQQLFLKTFVFWLMTINIFVALIFSLMNTIRLYPFYDQYQAQIITLFLFDLLLLVASLYKIGLTIYGRSERKKLKYQLLKETMKKMKKSKRKLP